MPTENDSDRPTIRQEAQANPSSAQPSTFKDNLIGTLLSGRYLIEKELGRGGMGVVYLARDKPELTSRPVVVKLLLEEAMKSEWVLRKFRHEIEALTRLDDPGAVGIFDAGYLPDKTPYFVMQYVEGTNLRSALKPEGMDFERVAGILKQIGRTVTKAHDKDILHRDLKPENIMLHEEDGEEQVKVIDFGVAKVKNSVMAPSTKSGILVGTVAYMSPEQLSLEPLTAASDIYALGVMAYEMLTGRRPFNPSSAFQLLEMQRAGIKIRPTRLRPDLPKAAEAVILKALAFNPKDRHQRARDFTEALAQALTNLPNGHQKPFPWMLVGTAAIAIALVGGALAFWSPWKGNPSGPPETPAATSPVDNSSTQPAKRTLSYWVEVQKYRNGKPDKTPMRQPRELIYQVDDRVRFFFTSPQQGHLYIVNEGPVETNGLPSYNLLFPTPTTNDASSALAVNQQVQVPGSWFKIDDERGTEKLWLIWSVDAIDGLEDIAKAVVTPQTGGVISDPGQIKWVRDFISKHSATKPEVVKDDEKKLTNINGGSDVLVSLLKLEHY